MKITEWLSKDPITLDKTRRVKNIRIHNDVFQILVSKIKYHFPDYANSVLGLKKRISFKGYNTQVQASIPYSNQPIEFYKWWRENETEVILSLGEKIKLFDIVFKYNQSLLTYEHRRLIGK